MALQTINVTVLHGQVLIPVTVTPVYVHHDAEGYISHAKAIPEDPEQQDLCDVYSMLSHLTISLMVDGEMQRQKWYHRYKLTSFRARRMPDGTYVMVNPAAPQKQLRTRRFSGHWKRQ